MSANKTKAENWKSISVVQYLSSVRVLLKVKVKEADLYSTFIEVPYTQGAQVRITQCYLQTTPYLPLLSDQSASSEMWTAVDNGFGVCMLRSK